MFEKIRQGVSNFIDRVAKSELKSEDLQAALQDFKLTLIENDVAVIVADHICEEIERRLVGRRINRFEDRRELVRETLFSILMETLQPTETVDLFELINGKRAMREPFTMVFIGINGTGKTTTIAKMAYHLTKNGYSVVLACSDTFRAGAIEQIETHAKRLGLPVIKHKYGSDAAAVAFDAVQYAKSRGINVVLIDTAGRMQTNKNLLMEMQKIVRVINPDMVIFVGDALAGNDAVMQAEEFNRFVRIDGSIMAKLDADAKGGAAISIAYVTRKPILFVGTGQKYEDLKPFDPEMIAKQIIYSR
ncbi:MAG: signal recognition particle-docking protein FtsY [Nitrososphaerota archaeon]|nr:signal recognition particle-docking protein FtsY [Candidatus Bathyarchaeota archaeon]MDW8048827.1 signal recognition particle-docking protein FtsY [Nitrososphaerota archaeon]